MQTLKESIDCNLSNLNIFTHTFVGVQVHEFFMPLQQQWFNKSVGDGADVVERSDLDPWQKFAYDIVCNCQERLEPLRMMLHGSAGTDKSRTVRSFVAALRRQVCAEMDRQITRARGAGADVAD